MQCTLGGTCVVGTQCVLVDALVVPSVPVAKFWSLCPIGGGSTNVSGKPVCVCSIPELCAEAGHA